MRCESALAPHSQFRSDEIKLGLDVPAGATATFPLVVRVTGAPGTEIENAFVIVVVSRRREHWRVLARIRVSIDEVGTPKPQLESTTTGRVGFADE